MKRGSSIGAPHAVQIATGCDGQPTLPSLREALEREPKYQRHIERAGRSGPRCRTWGQAAPVAERGNLKAPEVTQLNYRLTAKLHKAKVCDDRIAARAPRAATLPARRRQRDEIAPLHSITSSARASSVGGTSRPTVLAVWELMTSSSLVDCTTGKSAGFAPLRMRP